MKNISTIYASLFLCILLILSACGSAQAPLSGKVYRTEPEKANKSAQVALYASTVTMETFAEAKPLAETTTDANGQYVFSEIAEGAYLILVTLPGNDPALDTCTMVPRAGEAWIFYSLSYDAVGNPESIKYFSTESVTIKAGETLVKDFGWNCE